MTDQEMDAELIVAILKGDKFAKQTPALWIILKNHQIEAAKNRPKNVKAMQDVLRAQLIK